LELCGPGLTLVSHLSFDLMEVPPATTQYSVLSYFL
jgi:hypothetical protein